MKYFTNVVFDFRLNPYAMFSSGYNDQVNVINLTKPLTDPSFA